MPAIHFLYEKVTPRDDYQEEVDFLSTTNFFVTRNNFLAVGGFDANLRMAEDNEICLRLRKMIGGSFYQNAKTLVLHDISDVGRGADTFEYLNNRFNYMVVKFKTRNILLRRYQPWRLACLPVLEAISIMIYFAGAKAGKWHLARVDKVKSDAPVMAMIKDALVLTFYCIVGMSLLFLPADQGKRLGKSP
jgi:GT2 family glycosyltransferase